MIVQAQEYMGEDSANPTDPHHTPTIIQPYISQPRKTKQHIKPRIKVTEIPQPRDPTSVVDEAINKEMDESLERDATTATSLDAKHDRCNIFKTQSKATPNEPEDSLNFNELIKLCTKIQQRGLDLETTKTIQAIEIDRLKKRVKKLERRKWSRTHGLKRLYKVILSAKVESSKDEGLGEEDASKQGRIADIDANEDTTLVNGKVVKKEVNAAQIQVTTAATTPTILIDEATLAQALAKLKHAKPKAKDKGIVFHEPKESTTTTVAIPTLKS
nr:hypothetical protein [Tanacetum cinerariifolium]